MINKQTLKQYYDSRLRHKLENLESMRYEAKWLSIFAWLGFVMAITAVVLGIFVDMPHTLVFSLLVALVFGFTLEVTGMSGNKSYAYREKFKDEIVRIVVILIDPFWIYFDKGYVARENFQKSDLFQTHCSFYKGKSLVSGVIGKTDFSCSELHTGYKEDKKQYTVFHGLFFHADFHKHFKGRTYAYTIPRRKRADSITTPTGRAELTKLENKVFDNVFAVYASDPTEARYILTPAMMEAMLNIVDKYGWKMHFSFYDSRVYCAIDLPPNAFEPDVFRSKLSFEDVYQVYELFNLNKVIVEEMNLNTRIWTKQ